MVKVSIIIPVFNNAQYLPKCLDSIVGQTLRDIEIICVNDFSTDNSLSILEEFSSKDKRIRIINFDKNQGAACARNYGIKEARGQFVGFVDSDDFVDLNFYEALYNVAMKSSCEIVKGNIEIFCPKNDEIVEKSWIDINQKVIKNKASFYCAFTSAIFELSFIKAKEIKFLEHLVHFEDPYFAIKSALFAKKIEVIDNVYYHYVVNPASSSNKPATIEDINAVKIGVERILDLLDQHCGDQTHYMIVFNFLVEITLTWCDRIDVNNEITKKAIDILLILFDRCQFSRECSIYHFLERKNIRNQAFLEQKKSDNRKRLQEIRNNVRCHIKNA